MTLHKLTSLELRIMEALWNQGRLSIREILETFPERDRPAYSTVQTTVYRLEEKGAVKRLRKIGNAHIFDAAITRSEAGSRLVDDLLDLFGGNPQLVMAQMVEAGKLTLEDIREAEKLVQELSKRKEGGGNE
ncbi:MAG TPA: BlaI/MecI/CopY family transcriptional regulator [Candidatus Acidoferrales bacterium]|nr:BlaI/MecI/CopY family transcriptional regulator [Candidatus Acidoferrales bacterium]